MVYTYTHTYTKQEKEIRNLNELVFRIIENVFENRVESNLKYYGINNDGSISNDLPINLYSPGVLIGEDFRVNKKKGLVDYFGSDLNFEYIDVEGMISSSGQNYAGAYVQLNGKDKVDLLNFIDYPEVEEYIQKISNKFAELKENFYSQKL